MARSHTARARIALASYLLIAASGAVAGEPWIAPGEPRLRHDLLLLVDEGVIDLPVSAWPIAAADLAAALGRIDAGARLTPAQAAAVTRLGRRTGRELDGAFAELRGAARPTPLRTFWDEPREEGELAGGIAGSFGERWGGRLELAAVADPDDDQALRLDGTYLAGRFGNWIVTAGAQDRWWGSGWEGSLLLSSSARPVPALALDRAVSTPFESKWLRWIGPWRLTTFMGYMDGDREDYDHPLLFGFRVSARPLDGLEISLERTAQWCGEGRSCSFDDFWNLWWGNDNAGENVAAEDEPGNQLAGWDIRWASPVGDWPYALYFQHTGESIDNQLPRPYRSLELAGVEVWNEFGAGGSWRAALEWASTRCGGTENGERLWDCAYNNGIYDVEGYRYRGRPLGHAMDGDGQSYSLRVVLAPVSGDAWTAVLRNTRINEGGTVPDTRHSIAPGPEDWWGVDVVYRRQFGTDWVEIGVGVDQRDREWDGSDALLPRASLTWRRQL